jgi:hypothetical protein
MVSRRSGFPAWTAYAIFMPIHARIAKSLAGHSHGCLRRAAAFDRDLAVGLAPHSAIQNPARSRSHASRAFGPLFVATRCGAWYWHGAARPRRVQCQVDQCTRTRGWGTCGRERADCRRGKRGWQQLRRGTVRVRHELRGSRVGHRQLRRLRHRMRCGSGMSGRRVHLFARTGGLRRQLRRSPEQRIPLRRLQCRLRRSGLRRWRLPVELPRRTDALRHQLRGYRHGRAKLRRLRDRVRCWRSLRGRRVRVPERSDGLRRDLRGSRWERHELRIVRQRVPCRADLLVGRLPGYNGRLGWDSGRQRRGDGRQ